MEQVRAVFDLYQVGHACLQSLSDAAAPSEALWSILPALSCLNVVTPC